MEMVFNVSEVTEVHTDSVRSPQRKVTLTIQNPDFSIELLHCPFTVRPGDTMKLSVARKDGK